MYEVSPWFWLMVAATVFYVLWPADAQLLPHWVRLRLQLFGLNSYMRARAFGMWLQFPRPRPPFRYVPIQDRKPLR